MNALQIFSYNNTDIEFEVIDGELYANATAMCKAFDKRPVKWRELESTQRYIAALEEENLESEKRTPLVITRNHRFSDEPGQGTWIHQKLILKLAQWLDVKFEIWCDRCVQAFLNGSQKPALPSSYKEALLALFLEVEERERLQLEVGELKPKADYADSVLASDAEMTTTFVAKDLHMSAIALHKRLNEKGVVFKQSGTWLLYSKYDSAGLANMRTVQYYDRKGNSKTKHYLVWTEAGRKFIHELLNPKITTKQSMAVSFAIAQA